MSDKDIPNIKPEELATATAAEVQAGVVPLDAQDAAAAVKAVHDAAVNFWSEFEKAGESKEHNPNLKLKDQLNLDDLQTALAGGTPKHPVFLPMGILSDEALVGGLLQKIGVPLEKALERVVRLSPRERTILELREHSADGVPGRTLEQVGTMLEPSVSRARVQQIEHSALEKLADRTLEKSSSQAKRIARDTGTALGGVSPQLGRALRAAKIYTPEQLAEFTEARASRIPGLGRKSFEEARQWLASHRLAFKK
jgi:predicted flap endonuclease-1-like 5' DNA nuclease